MKKLKPILLITVIPFAIFVIEALFLKDIANFYMSWFDPVYAYLFNATNLAQGKFEIGHIDHPGTPLQVLAAVIIRITFIFENKSSLIEDVLSNPEHYLHIISLTLIILNSSLAFILAYVVYRKTNDLKTGIILQFTPIVSLVAMYYMPIVACESLLLFLGMCLVLFSFLYTYTENSFKPKSYLFWFSVISGLSIATKISSFPIVLIPLLILKGAKSKINYFLFTILSFLFFIIPILPKYSEHLYFLKNIISHTGRFGYGEKGIMDVQLFIQNFKILITEEFPFTFIYISLFITCLLMLIKRNRFITIDNKQKNLIFGIFILFSLQILIVSKHYSYHYLIPAYSFAVLGIYSLVRLYLPFLKKDYYKIKPTLLLIIGLIVFSGFTTRLVVAYHFYPNIDNPMKKTALFLKDYEKLPKIIIPMSYGCSVKESAFYFGMVYSGEQRTNYASLLKNLYPNTYFYIKERGLYDWQNNLMKNELFSKYNQLIIYTKSNDTIAINENLKALLQINSEEKLLELSKIYVNTTNEETIYLLKSDTAKVKNLSILKLNIFSDLEQLDSNKTLFIDSSKQYLFEKANLQSTEKSYSGKYSIKLTKENPYGLDIRLKLIENTYFKITVWRNAPNGDGVIVACSNDQTFYINSANVISTGENGWQLIELAFDVSKDIPNNELHVYLWNNGINNIYFDDFCIQGYY